MNIAVVDDAEEALRDTRELLGSALAALQLPRGEIRLFPSGEAFLAAWQPGRYDLILLDIYMDGISGIELARQVRAQDGEAEIVFCTSGNSFAAESYEVGAANYIQKPLTQEKLEAMLRRLDRVKLQRSRVLTLPDGYQCLIRTLRYTEYQNHTVRFFIAGEPPHSVYMTHGETEALLGPYSNFCCVNKGCIVNLGMVRRIVDSGFLMEDGEIIPIARRRFKEVQAAYTRYHFEALNEEVAE